MPDAKEFSIGRSRSPYKVEVAPSFKSDNSGEREQAFRAIRGEQEARNTQKKQLIGNLDTLSNDFTRMFTVFSEIRTKLRETERMPFLKRRQALVLKTIIKLVDKINSIITNKIIPLIDELGN